jgi:DNA polymerase sigma
MPAEPADRALGTWLNGPSAAPAPDEARAEAGSARPVVLPTGAECGAAEAARLEGACAAALAGLQPTAACQHRQGRLLQRLGRILRDVYGPQAQLEVFGSTVCMLAGRGSDLDMTFSPGFADRLSLNDKKKLLCKISKVLQSHGMRAVPVLGARVPIVKVKDQGDTWLAVDLSVENELPVYKSRLLHEFALIDDRVSKLVLLVKAWAKGRNINSAAQGAHEACPCVLSTSRLTRFIQVLSILSA